MSRNLPVGGGAGGPGRYRFHGSLDLALALHARQSETLARTLMLLRDDAMEPRAGADDDDAEGAAAPLPKQDLAALDRLAAARRQRRDGPVPMDPPQAAELLQALNSLLVRDACLGWTDPAAWWLWLDLITSAPRIRMPAPATLLAAVAAAWDDHAAAASALELALSAEPSYYLAQLLLRGLDRMATTAAVAEALHEGHQVLLRTHPEVAGLLAEAEDRVEVNP